MASKFSDAPYYIIEAFFQNLIEYDHVYSQKAILRGMGINISVVGGFGVDLYLKNANPSQTTDWTLPYKQYYKIKARNYELDSRNTDTGLLEDTYFTFNFESSDTAFNGSDMTFDELLDYANEADSSPVEVYFRKRHLFHDFCDANSDYEYFVNTNKEFLYFGELFTRDDNTFIVDYNNLANYAIKCLPVNNQTDNIKMFFEVFFDQFYSQIYNKMKTILVQSDPHEMDERYLYYLLNMFNVSTVHNMDEETERSFISNLPNLLERKGSYSSLYIVWQALMGDTTNLLNVYERWHPWELTSTPLENFTDYLYITYPYYDKSPPTTGAGAAYYHQLDIASCITEFTLSASSWTVVHGLENQWPLVQFVDDTDYVIVPDTITFTDENTVDVTFSEVMAGVATCSKASSLGSGYTHTQTSVDTIWYVGHNLGQKYPMVQIVNNNTVILPNSVQYIDDDNLIITFDIAMDGYAFLYAGDELSVWEQTYGNMEWVINHSLGNQYPIVQVVDSTGYMVLPDEIRCPDENNVIISFSEALSGSALIFNNLYSTSYAESYTTVTSGGCMSPHYRVEIDLSNEPFGDDYIIDEDRWTDLLTYWEEMRPVCKYSHYNAVISPISDFKGYYRALYDGSSDNNGYLYSICCNPVTTVATDCFVYSSTANSSEWIITHTLASTDLVVQCFDTNKYQLEPASIEFIDITTIRIKFYSSVNGYAFISLADYTHEQAIAALSWTASHSLGEQYLIYLAKNDDTTQTAFIPVSVTMTDENSSVIVVASSGSGDTGKISLSRRAPEMETPFVAPAPGSDTWVIWHGLNAAAVQIQCFDTNDKVIFPDSVKINDRNTVTVSWGTGVLKAGTAIIRDVGFDATIISGWMDTITTVKIGSGGGATWDSILNNDIETVINEYSPTLIEEDSKYYYVKVNITDNVEMTITEIGIFDLSGEIMFYTYMSPIFKPSNVELIIWYRIEKITR